MQVLAAGRAGLEVAGAVELQRRLVRRPEVGRAAEEPRNVLREHVQHLARRVAARRCPWHRPGTPAGCGPSRSGSSRRCIWSISVASAGILRAIGGEQLVPRRVRRRAARADAGSEVLAHAVGHQELRVLGPAVGALGEPHLLHAERLAVRRGRVLPVRRAVADVAVEDDQRRPALGLRETPAARARCARCRWRRRRAARSSRSRGSARRRPR